MKLDAGEKEFFDEVSMLITETRKNIAVIQRIEDSFCLIAINKWQEAIVCAFEYFQAIDDEKERLKNDALRNFRRAYFDSSFVLVDTYIDYVRQSLRAYNALLSGVFFNRLLGFEYRRYGDNVVKSLEDMTQNSIKVRELIKSNKLEYGKMPVQVFEELGKVRGEIESSIEVCKTFREHVWRLFKKRRKLSRLLYLLIVEITMVLLLLMVWNVFF